MEGGEGMEGRKSEVVRMYTCIGKGRKVQRRGENTHTLKYMYKRRSSCKVTT